MHTLIADVDLAADHAESADRTAPEVGGPITHGDWDWSTASVQVSAQSAWEFTGQISELGCARMVNMRALTRIAQTVASRAYSIRSLMTGSGRHDA